MSVPLEKPIAIIMRDCTVYAFTLAPSGHLTHSKERHAKFISLVTRDLKAFFNHRIARNSLNRITIMN